MGNQISLQRLRKKKEKHKKKNTARHEQNQKDMEEGSDSSDEYEDILEIEDMDDENEDAPRIVIDKECGKKRFHDECYKPFGSLTLNDLPDPIRHQALFDYINARGNLVVRIKVTTKSPAREQNDGWSWASGYAWMCEDETVKDNCPFPDCSISCEQDHKVYGGILVTTNTHVVIDEFEAKKSEFHFFCDNENDSSHFIMGHGYALQDDNANKDKDYVGVKVFLHDASVVERIMQYSSDATAAWHRIPQDLQVEFEKHAVSISHPHGWPKKVSFGDLICKEELDEDSGYVESRYNCLTCKGSSGSPVLTGFYWNNPFVHSSWKKRKRNPEETGKKKNIKPIGVSYFY